MAYPTVSAPYGLKPVNLIGGQVFAGQTRELPITTSSVNYSTAIYNGDVVAITSSGTVIKSALAADSSPLAGTIGIFVGASYTNPSTNQKIFTQSWPGFASGVTDAVAYIVDDPDALFKVASVGATADSTGLTVTALAQTVLGNNVALVQNTGKSTTGDSKEGVYASTGSTTTLPFRVIAGVPETVNASGSFTEVIVKFNFGVHTYYSATAVATAA